MTIPVFFWRIFLLAGLVISAYRDNIGPAIFWATLLIVSAIDGA